MVHWCGLVRARREGGAVRAWQRVWGTPGGTRQGGGAARDTVCTPHLHLLPNALSVLLCSLVLVGVPVAAPVAGGSKEGHKGGGGGGGGGRCSEQTWQCRPSLAAQTRADRACAQRSWDAGGGAAACTAAPALAAAAGSGSGAGGGRATHAPQPSSCSPPLSSSAKRCCTTGRGRRREGTCQRDLHRQLGGYLGTRRAGQPHGVRACAGQCGCPAARRPPSPPPPLHLPVPAAAAALWRGGVAAPPLALLLPLVDLLLCTSLE